MNRFTFVHAVPSLAIAMALAVFAAGQTFMCSAPAFAGDVLAEFKDPPREFSVMPFWFWNDDLKDEEIVRQIADFEAHGVYGFVIHPRIGLPRDIAWLSPRMIHAMHVAVDEAARRKMYVILYDEGMYPSGSSSGQVVAENPAFRTRGLFAVDLDTAKPGDRVQGLMIGADGQPAPEKGQNLIAVVPRKSDGHRIAVFDRAISEGRSTIRGLHFRDVGEPADGQHQGGHRHQVRQDHPLDE